MKVIVGIITVHKAHFLPSSHVLGFFQLTLNMRFFTFLANYFCKVLGLILFIPLPRPSSPFAATACCPSVSLISGKRDKSFVVLYLLPLIFKKIGIGGSVFLEDDLH